MVYLGSTGSTRGIHDSHDVFWSGRSGRKRRGETVLNEVLDWEEGERRGSWFRNRRSGVGNVKNCFKSGAFG